MRHGESLDKSELICHDCLESNVRPSYIETPLEELKIEELRKNSKYPKSEDKPTKVA